jgi:hypothetical protein
MFTLILKKPKSEFEINARILSRAGGLIGHRRFLFDGF